MRNWTNIDKSKKYRQERQMIGSRETPHAIKYDEGTKVISALYENLVYLFTC